MQVSRQPAMQPAVSQYDAGRIFLADNELPAGMLFHFVTNRPGCRGLLSRDILPVGLSENLVPAVPGSCMLPFPVPWASAD